MLDLQLMQKGRDGFKIAGEEPYQLAGYAVSSAGDFNQDGYDDYVVGAYGGYSNGFYRGAAYLVYGSGNSISSINLEELTSGIGGFKISGAAEFDETGFAVAAAGDVNGDGLDDFLIGAPFDAPYYGMVDGAMAGKAYVVSVVAMCLMASISSPMTLGTDGGTRDVGLRIIGEQDFDRAGVSIASAERHQQRGRADGYSRRLARQWPRRQLRGAAYVIFGQDGSHRRYPSERHRGPDAVASSLSAKRRAILPVHLSWRRRHQRRRLRRRSGRGGADQ